VVGQQGLLTSWDRLMNVTCFLLSVSINTSTDRVPRLSSYDRLTGHLNYIIYNYIRVQVYMGSFPARLELQPSALTHILDRMWSKTN